MMPVKEYLKSQSKDYDEAANNLKSDDDEPVCLRSLGKAKASVTFRQLPLEHIVKLLWR